MIRKKTIGSRKIGLRVGIFLTVFIGSLTDFFYAHTCKKILFSHFCNRDYLLCPIAKYRYVCLLRFLRRRGGCCHNHTNY